LLAEQVELLRARQDGHAPLPFEKTWTSLDLPVPAFIPPEYVTDDPVRLRLYQRFSAVEKDEQLTSLVSELEDRFGALPEPAQNLVYLTSLRLRATAAGVEALTATDAELIVKFDTLPALNVGRLERVAGVSLKRGSNQLRFARGQGQAWMGRLYELVSAIAQREEFTRTEPIAEYASAR
jgi:transcription-repair coupling factor (superfamily II helicase)